jgi:uncharacterized protein (UPF0332 family)
MSYSKEAIVNYNVLQSHKAFEDAKLLANHQSWDATVNRLYYASYYMVKAMLTKNKLNAKTHSGVQVLFHQHFVKEKIVTEDSAQLFSDLFNKRQEADYRDFFNFDKTTVLPLIDQTEQFLKEIESHI